MSIEHDFFGVLESGPDGSIFWSETVEFGDQAVTVDLTAPDESNIVPDALNIAAAMISQIEAVALNARESMVTQLSDRTSEVTEYTLQQQVELGDELEDYLSDISGDTPIDIIKALRLMSVTILADEHGGTDPFFVMEYALDTDTADNVLLVNLASDGSVLSVTSAE